MQITVCLQCSGQCLAGWGLASLRQGGSLLSRSSLTLSSYTYPFGTPSTSPHRYCSNLSTKALQAMACKSTDPVCLCLCTSLPTSMLNTGLPVPTSTSLSYTESTTYTLLHCPELFRLFHGRLRILGVLSIVKIVSSLAGPLFICTLLFINFIININSPIEYFDCISPASSSDLKAVSPESPTLCPPALNARLLQGSSPSFNANILVY